MNKSIISLVVIFIVGVIAINVYNQSNVTLIQNCKVMDLQQQSIIKGEDGDISTEIRYLVITDKETFVCENSLLNGKFNNSDIFWRLKKDSNYNFKVAGLGKSMITEYRNILEVVK